MRGEEILKEWQSWIEQAVSKGANYKEYAKVLSPSSIVTSNSNNLALKLLGFQIVDINNIALPQPKTKKERAKQLSEDIVMTA
jgi:hypothetical protein